MNRQGHLGMTLLAFAPVAYVFAGDGKFLLAVLCWIGIQAVEPLPDQDFHLPILTHRGISHSLLAVVVVGGVLGGAGWLLGGHGFELLYSLLSAIVGVWNWLLGFLPDASAILLTGIMPNVPPGEIVATIQHQAGGNVGRWSFAMFGGFIGAYGVLAHLLGDVITVRGIKPFLPVSRWQLSLSSLRADSPTANSGLFGLGVVAIAVVLVATVPGAIFGAGMPADLSPVGIAAGQDASAAQNGSVTINRTESNRTQIVLENVSLPQNGYIVAQTGNVSANQSGANTSVVGHTQYVRNGTFHDVVLNLNQSVTNGTPVSVVLYNDSTGNRTLDVASNGSTDAPYRTPAGTPIHDTLQLGANATATNQSQASVVFANQTTNGTNVTIPSVTLPEGGFIAIHGPGYARQGVVSGSAITVSRYLEPGTHRNVTIQFSNGVPGAVSNITEFKGAYAPLSAVLYRDTNGNKHYDYVDSIGQNDTSYRRGETRVNDQARVVTQQQLDRTNRSTAAVTLSNQSAADGTLTVKRVRLPNGGWIVIHNQTYLTENDPLTSVVGRSRHLAAGTHRNVTVRLNGSLDHAQPVVAVPYRDTNGNNRYDYLRSSGVSDAAYVNRTGPNATLVTDRAHVAVPSPTPTGTPTTSTVTPTHTPSPTTTDAPRTSPTESSVPTTARPSASGGVLSGASIWLKGVLLVVGVVIGLTLIGRVT